MSWLGLLLLAAAFLAWRLPRVELQTNIFSLVPWQARHPAAEDGAQVLREQLQKNALLLVGAPRQDRAMAAADAAAAGLRALTGVAGVVCQVDETRAAEALEFFEPWRSFLYTAADRAALRGDGQSLVQDAQEGLYLPAGLSLGFDRDPFGTYGRWLAQRGGQTGRLGLSQGHLGLEDGGLSYVAVMVELAPPAGGLAAKQALAAGLDAASASARAAGATRVLRAGYVFYDLAATRQASGEIQSIGTVSLVLLFVLLLLVLPQWGPRWLAFAPLLVGSVCGAAAVLLFWHEVHMVALVFGSTVVGVAEDYGLYFLCGVYDPGAWDSAARGRAARGPSGLALLTSVLGYAALCFLPIPALRQVAVFATVGLCMDWAGVLLWYPVLARRARVADPPRLERAEALAEAWPRWGRQRWLGPALAALILASGLGLARLRADDDVRLLYAHDASLDAEQKEIARLSGVGSGTGFFVAGAADPQALLRLEEAALDRLDLDPQAGSWTGVSRMVPSEDRQTADRSALERALFGKPDVAARLQRALQAPGLKTRLRRSLAAPTRPLTPEAWLASPVSTPYRHLWRGARDGAWYGLLVSTAPTDAAALERAEGDLAGVSGLQYVDQLQEVTQVLARLRRVLSWALAGGALLVLLLLWLALKSSAWPAALPTALGALAALGTLGWAGLPFNLFALLGLMLLLGTGIDFGIYLQATGPRACSSFVAVNLAALTNIAAVGVLAFSGTEALRSFGLVLAVGAGVAWLTAPCFRPKERIA
jgi:predicted exporter